MGNYIYTIIVAGIFVAVIILLSPDGQTGKVGKYISFIGALAVALVILSPLPKFLFENDIVNIPDSYTGGIITGGETAKGEYLASLAGMTLSEIYGTDIENVKAYVYCNDSGEIEKIILSVKEETFYDKKEAGEVLSEICDVKIEVEEYKGEGKEG